MFDTSRALEDMANQVRACRSSDGLTLQQLAARSGVAASTIHKVEAQQMVPTVAVLLKIAKGLGRRPQDLIRDSPSDLDGLEDPSGAQQASAGWTPPGPNAAGGPSDANSSLSSPLTSSPLGASLSSSLKAGSNVDPSTTRSVGDVAVWQINLGPEKMLPTLDLHPLQRATLLVRDGGLDLQAGDRRFQMNSGDCIEVEGERIQSRATRPETASLLLIVSPPGQFDQYLGEPMSRSPRRP